MNIDLQFFSGTGSLVHVNRESRGEPLHAVVTLDLGGEWTGAKLCLNLTAHSAQAEGIRCYELFLGPLRGCLFQKNALTSEDADFEGCIGPNNEILVLGWKRATEEGKLYIALKLHNKTFT